ncbi:hypothetical protein AS156_08120 [Bradyrhizobium macuxiense]|uniref:Uncharacterized protein n=1 Tax=Bradyrhizobium macuxiense TaxID=1755647 RepID=A0A109JQI0_9BRAD|nr:hypothetical protein AS156_08120 [Bradyrhizobium macuxiense]
MQVVVGEPPMGERRCVGSPDDDGACLAQVRDNRTVVAGDDVAEFDHTVGGGAAALVDVDLHRDRDAMQRTEHSAGLARSIGGIRSRKSFIGEHLDDRVQGRVDGCDAIEACLHRLAARNHAARNGTGEIRGSPTPQFISHVVTLPSSYS